MINRNRLARHFEQLSVIGVDAGGGVTRLAFSDADWKARHLIIDFMKQAGLVVRADAFGNLIGRLAGRQANAPAVMLGSHIDSVPQGGNYDGIVGVLGAIEAVQCLAEKKIRLDHPIEIVAFMAEESSRFGYSTLGSKAFCGKLAFENLEAYKDKQGISLAEAMRLRQLEPEQISSARYEGKIKAFLELHIEQGKVLETAKKQIGVVTGIAAPTRLRVVVAGKADHSGATPMNMRQDALTAAAEIILQVEKLAQCQTGVVGTTGIIQAEPGVMNVIPGKVELGIDIRSISAESKQQVIQQLSDALINIMNDRGVKIEITTLTDETPIQLSMKMVHFLENLCTQSNYASMLMPSGAGHDAMHMAEIAETGMLFIPCRDGISHNSAEWASIEDIAAGTEVLMAAIAKLARQGSM